MVDTHSGAIEAWCAKPIMGSSVKIVQDGKEMIICDVMVFEELSAPAHLAVASPEYADFCANDDGYCPCDGTVYYGSFEQGWSQKDVKTAVSCN